MSRFSARNPLCVLHAPQQVHVEYTIPMKRWRRWRNKHRHCPRCQQGIIPEHLIFWWGIDTEQVREKLTWAKFKRDVHWWFDDLYWQHPWLRWCVRIGGIALRYLLLLALAIIVVMSLSAIICGLVLTCYWVVLHWKS